MVTVERRMTPHEMDEFLREPNLARIGTINPDGSPHVTPIWFTYIDGEVTFSIGKRTRKARNLSKDNRVSICIDEGEHPNRTVILNGVTIPLGDTTDEYRLRAAVHYLGDERGREYSLVMAGFPSTTYRVEPTRIVTWYYAERRRKQSFRLM